MIWMLLIIKSDIGITLFNSIRVLTETWNELSTTYGIYYFKKSYQGWSE